MELLDSSPVFGDALRACGRVLEGLVDWGVEDVLRGVEGAPSLDRVDVVQPVSFAVMVALAGLWRSFGVEPGVVVGHSQGEIAAACVAGGLSLEDAARVVVLRSRLLGEVLAGRGGMVSVALDVDRVEELLEGWGGRLGVAAVNGPSAVVVSGESGALDELLGVCERDGVWARRVAVDYASHSVAVEELRERLVGALVGIEPVSCGVPFFSTATGGLLDTAELDGEYWYRSLRERVRFCESTRALVPDASVFIEVSPHPVLTMAVQGTLEDVGLEGRVGVVGSLQRGEGGMGRFVRSLAQAWVGGAPVDWGVFFEGSGAQRVDLPRYAFQRERYWLTPRAGAGDVSHAGLGVSDHPLLGAAVQLAGGEGWLFTGRLALDTHPWLADHAVLDTVLLPGTGFLELALAAGREVGCRAVEELTLQAPLVLTPGAAVQLQVAVGEPDGEGRRQVTVYSRPQAHAGDANGLEPSGLEGWTQHATGTLLESAASEQGLESLGGQWPPAGAQELDVEFLYDRLAEAGFGYGPVFQGVQAAWREEDAIFVEVALEDDVATEAGRFAIHPALLDAALHTGLLEWGEELGPNGQVLPFSLGGVSLWQEGMSSLRVRLTRNEGGTLRLTAFDGVGAPTLSMDSLAVRPVEAGVLQRAPYRSHDSLHRLEWVEAPVSAPVGEPPRLVLLGGYELDGVEGEGCADLVELVGSIADGAPVPDVVLAAAPVDCESGDVAMAARAAVQGTLALLQEWLAASVLEDARLVLVTSGAVAAVEGEAPDLVGAPVWGLLRSAQSEHLGRFVIVDTDDGANGVDWLGVLEVGESQLVVRGGRVFVPRLVGLGGQGSLLAPVGERRWHLASGRKGTLEDLELVASPGAWEPLGAEQVRVAVHAAGVNFRDLFVALGFLPGVTMIGGEGAGVVLEVGEGVGDLAPGDRVFGLMRDAFGPVAVTERELVVRMPEGWSFVQAASVPVVFLTAYYGLVDLAGLQRGESLLIHSAAGGVGMAALQIARHLGAEVFATASPAKAGVLAELGLDPEHVASSRDLEFAGKFLRVTEGGGVDVVLNSLTREFVDTSLGLLPRGGRFLEMGKADIRVTEQIAQEYPGVRYRAFDAQEAGPGRTQEILREIVSLFERGVFTHLPITTWDVRRGAEAFRFIREARHVGKIVLTVPQPLDPQGTVLITGGTGGLGALLARHLASRHGARRLLLASRSGPGASGVEDLVAELEAVGCEARVVACDVADREAARGLLDAIPAEHPLTAVVHAAGVLDDGVIGSLTPEQVERVARPKIDAALNLHELTEGVDVAEFVLFSSAAGLFGGAGQGNYAAANAFLDALAQARQTQGLPAQSLAWGLWEQESAMTGGLGEAGRARIERLGVAALSAEQGFELFDSARSVGDALLAAVRLDRSGLRAQARAGALPALLGDLVQAPARRERAAGGSLARRLAGIAESQRDAVLLDVVRSQVAGVLGHDAVGRVDPERSFKDLGFDSLSAVELRNRLAQATGLRLPATLVFDHPNCLAVAQLLRSLVEGVSSGAADVEVVARRTGVDEPVAIVGMSCRYPGGVASPEELWELVAQSRDAITGFPENRGWDLERLYEGDHDHLGAVHTRAGGFIHDAGEFDADFFSISPREALGMDPQQRLLLEAAWEALEDAGIDPALLRGSQTGVFAGVIHSDYRPTGGDGAPHAEGDNYLAVGSSASVVSGRVAYTFGFEGPAVSVDTACSSSLVALHLACQAVRQGECSLALAGGVSVICNSRIFLDIGRQQVGSVDGRCKSFAACADGSGFSDGVGLLVLERLSDARRLGHRVLGVVRGSAVNQDGASNGLTAPNGPSQERVIRRALMDAGLVPGEVDVVEAHGTGTTLGDPIEAQALLATYGQGRTSGPLWLGSLKSNIGHAQAAAGVGGVIKLVKAFEHGLLPRTLHVDQPTPHVDWSAGEVELLLQPRPWPAGERPRRAGVSSFGISGTNAHVILEEPPAGEGVSGASELAADGGGGWSCGVVPLVVSGRGEGGLCGQAGRLREFLSERPQVGSLDGGDSGLLDVAFSLAGRVCLEDRGAVLGRDRAELLEGLGVLAGPGAGERVVRGVAGDGRAVFVFPGQGAQWEGMAVELLDTSEVFRAGLRACDEALEGLVEWRVEDVLRGVGGTPGLERVDVVQPVSFAVAVALAGVWRSFGVEPSAVVGHSQGEIAAACVAGGLSLRDAARVVVLRSRLLGEVLAGRGGMVSVALGVDQVQERLAGWGGRLSVAAVNGPRAVVVSGASGALDELLAACEGDGVWARRVAVDYASHSVAVEELREQLLGALEGLEPVSCGVPFFSTATGGFVDTAELDGDYWYRSLRERVRFEDAVRALAGETGAFIEVSPHPVLTVAVRETLEEMGVGERVGVLGTLQRGEGGLERIAHSLAEAWVWGVPVDWSVFFAGSGARAMELPRYAFQRRHYWPGPELSVGNLSGAGLGVADHPLLGAAVQLAGGEGWLFTGRLALDTHPWLADHAVLDTVLLPGTGFLELALAAGRAVGCEAVEELVLHAPLILTPGDAVQLQVSVGEPDETGRRPVNVYSRPQAGEGRTQLEAGEGDGVGGGWACHARGVLLADVDVVAGQVSGLGVEGSGLEWPPVGVEELDVEFLYDRLGEAGFGYGPVFQGVRAAWHGEGAVYVEVALDGDVAPDAARFGVHPALLDAALHGLYLLDGVEELFDPGAVVLPFSLGGVSLRRVGAGSLRVRVTRGEGGAIAVVACDEAGELVVSIGSLVLRSFAAGEVLGARPGGDFESLYRLEWVELPESLPVEGGPYRCVLLGDVELAGVEGERYVDLAELLEVVQGGAAVPDVVFAGVPVGCVAGDAVAGAQAVRGGTQRVLEWLQAWLACPGLADARLVFVTNGAVAVTGMESLDLVGAAVWGLLRSAQSEHPGRFVVVDCDQDVVTPGGGLGWLGLLGVGEPQLAVRGGCAYTPRLVGLSGSGVLRAPAQESRWHLGCVRGGTLDELALVGSARAWEPLGPREVRVGVRAGGLNFRDVLIALGVYPGGAVIGSEGAGVVLEVGEGVGDLAPGDRVMGLMPEAFGPVAVAERELVARMPEGWSFVQAAAVPSVFLTAYYALVDLAGLKDGESLLVHAAAGGVGMAAVQLARHLGAEVFATASPGKAGVLAGLGLDREHIASSRDVEFEQRFLSATGGGGVDVVLNSLAREFVDASLGLLPRGGRFIELGKTDVRDVERVAEEHPGVRYRAIDLQEAGPGRIQEMLREVLGLFERGVLCHPPITTWDVREGVRAFRVLRESRHVGKIVLTVPQPPDPEGTVLVTGGTGVLGGLVARRLAEVHGARHLLLVSRRGPAAEGAGELVGELAKLGCEAEVVACDVADPAQARELIASVPAEHPLTSVIHAAGVLDDGLIESLSAEQVERVMRPKVNAALNLHELTAEAELAEFVLFSSAAGLFGNAGQGNYAAANSFVDALAQMRRARGLAGQSLAWGWWEQESGLTGVMGEAGRSRLTRTGVIPFTNGPELFDAARSVGEALVAPVRLDAEVLRSQARARTLPALLDRLVRRTARREREGVGSLARQLAGVPEAEREATVQLLVRAHAASVLGHDSPQTIGAQRAFKALGLDSLGAVELRNRLARATGLRLPSTLVFDHPNAAALASYLVRKVAPGADGGNGTDAEELEIRRVLASIPIVRLRESGLYEQLAKLAGPAGSAGTEWASTEEEHAAIDEMDAETLVRMTFGAEAAEETGGRT